MIRLVNINLKKQYWFSYAYQKGLILGRNGLWNKNLSLFPQNDKDSNLIQSSHYAVVDYSVVNQRSLIAEKLQSAELYEIGITLLTGIFPKIFNLGQS